VSSMYFEPPSFDPHGQSDCLRHARSRLCLDLNVTQATPLRAMTFATRTGSQSESWYALKDSVAKRACGEVCHSSFMSKTDPIQDYVVVRLWSGALLEAVEFVSDPGVVYFYVQGTALGRMCEEDVPRPKTWWQRLLGGTRIWRVLLHEKMIGSVELNYPVTKTTTKATRVFLQLTDGRSLPIGLANVWFRKETTFVIPPDTPTVTDSDLEMLHFLLVIVFRVVVTSLDFGI